jgi:two-component system, OmpR family, response regulator MprA
MKKPYVAIVDDDSSFAAYLRTFLSLRGYEARCYTRGDELLASIKQNEPPDVILLDVMMPGLDGLELTRRLRRESVRTPILLLTARDGPEDVVRGLDAGADDYLTKPFSFDVLVARIRARTRGAAPDGARLRYADLVLDAATREVTRGRRRLSLTRTEFALLECLMRAPGRVVTRDRLIEQVWGDRDVTANNLEVFVRFLRAKIDREGDPRLIHTERGVGYSLRSEAP